MSKQTTHDIFKEANDRGVAAALVALEWGKEHLIAQHGLWLDPVIDDADDAVYPSIDLVGERSDVLTDYCRSLAASIQFPVNTAYLHGLGVVSSAMNRTFRYNYYGTEKPCNLYTVTAQPPSSGKSGINAALTHPCRMAYIEINKKNASIAGEAADKIKRLKEQLEDAGGDNERDALRQDIQKLQEVIENHPHYRYSVDDATPEALESIAFNQGGVFNVITDESDAINILMGNVYSERTANHGIFLKGWDGDFHSSARVTRKTKEGPVFGTVSAIAQPESIRAILQAGLSGRGISERMLILCEPSLMGRRNRLVHIPVDKEARQEYDRMIFNMLNEEGVTLQLSKPATEYMQAYLHNLEPKMAPGGEYSHTMLMGVIGKADKQIHKLASIVHAVNNWCDGGNRSKIITDDTLIYASHIFDQLSKTYISAADSQGYFGDDAAVKQLKEILIKKLEKSQMMTVEQIRSAVKNNKLFQGVSKLSATIKEKYLPALEEANYCVVHENRVFINPKLR